MNEEQLRNLKKYGRTRPPEPDFVVRKSDASTKSELSDWVDEHLRVGPKGKKEQIVRQTWTILEQYGAAHIFSETHMVGRPDTRSTIGSEFFFVKVYLVRAPEE